jgi:hypothetical protein
MTDNSAMNPKLGITLIIVGVLIVIAAALFARTRTPEIVRSPSPTDQFEYSFNVDGVLEEAGSAEESASEYWWVDSGGLMNIVAGAGSTIQGTLPEESKWRMLYASSNPQDTDNGLHPQNIFRLLTKSEWKNFSQEMYFRVTNDNMSDSRNRDESNGLLLLSRYTDARDLYYAGVRVDGHVVIKKKLNGVYHTLLEDPYFPGSYSRAANKSLLPKNTWIGLRSEVLTLGKDHVKIRLYLDVGGTGKWELVGDADDRDNKYGPVIDESGFAGVRTDFMDVEFKGYKVSEL